MEALVLQPLKGVDWSASEPPWLAQLRRENLELRQQSGYWRSQHAAAKLRIAELEHEVASLRGENRKLQDQLFGRKSETSAATDRSNHLDDPDDTPQSRPRGQRRDRPGPKRRDYGHLPVREELRELPEPQRICPTCGRLLIACGAEVSEQLEIETEVYRRVIRRRRYQRTCRCPGPRTVAAPAVPKLVAVGKVPISSEPRAENQQPGRSLICSSRVSTDCEPVSPANQPNRPISARTHAVPRRSSRGPTRPANRSAPQAASPLRRDWPAAHFGSSRAISNLPNT